MHGQVLDPSAGQYRGSHADSACQSAVQKHRHEMPIFCHSVAAICAQMKATQTEQAPGSDAINGADVDRAAHVHAAPTADRGAAAAAAGSAAPQPRTAADADAAMAALLVGAPFTTHHWFRVCHSIASVTRMMPVCHAEHLRARRNRQSCP